MQVAGVVPATAAGSVFVGHGGDSGCRLVGRLRDLAVPTTLKTWRVQQAIRSVVAIVLYIHYIA